MVCRMNQSEQDSQPTESKRQKCYLKHECVSHFRECTGQHYATNKIIIGTLEEKYNLRFSGLLDRCPSSFYGQIYSMKKRHSTNFTQAKQKNSEATIMPMMPRIPFLQEAESQITSRLGTLSKCPNFPFDGKSHLHVLLGAAAYCITVAPQRLHGTQDISLRSHRYSANWCPAWIVQRRNT